MRHTIRRLLLVTLIIPARCGACVRAVTSPAARQVFGAAGREF